MQRILTRLTTTLTLLLGLSPACLAADNTLTEQEQHDGWQLLFNGADTSQWRNFKKPDLDNERASDRKIDSHRSGSLYDMIASHPSSHRPAGEWNQVRILFQDRFLQVWQNGVATVTIDMNSSTWETLLDESKFDNWKGFGEASSGHLGLQDHGDRVSFKNLKIKEL